MKKPSLVFFGNSAFSVTVLEALVESAFTLKAVITGPDEPKGRGHVLTPPPTALFAKEHHVPLLQPKRPSKDVIPKSDVAIIASYGHIIPQEVLEIPDHGTLNVHPSLLPLYRGPSPIQTALANGEQKTGVTIMLTDQEVDHGPIIAQQELTIDDADDASTLEPKLARLGGKLLAEIIEPWTEGSIKSREQDHAKATFTKLLTKDSGHINWHRPARHIVNHVRAYVVWPGAWSLLGNERLKILRARVTSSPRPEKVLPGAIISSKGICTVAAEDFFVELEIVQPQSRAPMSGAAFLAGHQAALESVLQ